MSKSDLISVIMPTFNDGEFIKTALESIQFQTYQEIEIIVVDDGSTDDTEDIVRYISRSDNRITYVKNEVINKGKFNRRGVNVDAGCFARNVGISHANGEWITFQDSDDFSLLNRIDIQHTLALENGVDSVVTNVFWLEKFAEKMKIDLDTFIMEQNPIFIGSTEIEKKSHSNRGIFGKVLPDKLFGLLPFGLKKSNFFLGLFFNGFESYPGAANSCFIRSHVFKDVRFRSIEQRRWPSKKGRGADRDFNFNVAGSGFKCLCVDVPLYAWRTPTPFSLPYELSKYLY